VHHALWCSALSAISECCGHCVATLQFAIAGCACLRNKVSELLQQRLTLQENYQAGQTISVRIAVVANHGGRFEFNLCDSDQISESCFKKYPLKTCAPTWPAVLPVECQLVPQSTSASEGACDCKGSHVASVLASV
jgi:hypothetical protein